MKLAHEAGNLPNPPRLASIRKSTWGPALAIFVVAFLVRLALLSRVSHEDLLYGTLTSQGLQSGEEGIRVALSLLKEGRFSDPFLLPTGPTAHLPPSFPATTALIFWFFGTGITGALVRNLVNISGYALTFALLPATTSALGIGRRAGLFAGFVAAIYPIFRSTEVFRGRDEWLAALLLLGVTVGVYRLAKLPEMRLAAIYGLAWGVLMYVQPSALTVFPLHLIIFFRHARRYSPLLRLQCCAAAALILIAVVIPWTIRNRLALGGWIFMRDNLGLELYVSNGEGASASLQENYQSGWYCSVHPMCSPSTAVRVRELGELRFNQDALREAADWIGNNGMPFCRLSLERVLFFWADMPSNRITFLIRAALSFIAFVGLALMWREGFGLQAAILSAILFAYPLPYYVVQYSNRYVATISFAFLIPAAFTCVWLASRVTKKRPLVSI